MFDPELVEPYLLGCARDNRADGEHALARKCLAAVRAWREMPGRDEATVGDAYDAFTDAGIESECLSSVHRWGYDIMWTYHALEKFVELLDADGPTP